ncbi:hypothetical protein F4553_003671 [Allocatelliglobosispora scoriae]|uniref:Uncharacterized protein n=1 Tax=Allocatelliglobosispora scoriae TaxID=643052 RepID=A0A841BU71_9ACTN|nr:hypothetical protein [Allocatelliglobosispora scoriae]MBB5870292.1 hypothetical protein [Allocatelliglobosispora scoriae]
MTLIGWCAMAGQTRTKLSLSISRLIPTALLALAVVACGTGEGGPEESPAVSVTTAASTKPSAATITKHTVTETRVVPFTKRIRQDPLLNIGERRVNAHNSR